jgi:predicted ABC-type ATPase
MPDFTVIAGPNGAGKSTFSKRLSSETAFIFDADKIRLIKEKEYPDLPAQSIWMMIDSAYWEAEEIGIKNNSDLTVETNLRDDFLVNRALYFKNKGYTINLIFMLLPDVQRSSDMVNLRVDQKGHFIDRESIKYNFEYSLKMLKGHFGVFDNLLLLDSFSTSDITVPEALLIIKNKEINFLDPNAPTWARPVLDEIVQKLKNK